MELNCKHNRNLSITSLTTTLSCMQR